MKRTKQLPDEAFHVPRSNKKIMMNNDDDYGDDYDDDNEHNDNTEYELANTSECFISVCILSWSTQLLPVTLLRSDQIRF